ncbi:MAG: mechanosensitive ion channel family protein [Betaproteobacteria bacterium]
MKEKQALKLLSQVWAELQQPDIVWQLAALLACFAVAALISHWWNRRTTDRLGRLRDASNRIALPLAAMLLTAVTREVLEGVIHVQLLSVAIPLFASLALVRVCVYVLRQSFVGAAWLVVSERWVTAVIWAGLALYITGLSTTVIDALERIAFTVGNNHMNLWMLAQGVLTVVVTVILALWVAGRIEARLMLAKNLDSSLRIVSVRVTKALLMLVALLTGLSLVGIDITALSVFSGALGVGLGLGLQKIASNYVSGFIILLERSIRIGDVVQIGADTTGTVTEITTRYTVLKNAGGIEFIVPNETLIGSTVQNQSYSDNRLRVAVSIGVSYATADLESVLRRMEDIARKNPRVLTDPLPTALLSRFGDNAIHLEVGFWIANPQLGTGTVRSEVSLAILHDFREMGVAVAAPQ